MKTEYKEWEEIGEGVQTRSNESEDDGRYETANTEKKKKKWEILEISKFYYNRLVINRSCYARNFKTLPTCTLCSAVIPGRKRPKTGFLMMGLKIVLNALREDDKGTFSMCLKIAHC